MKKTICAAAAIAALAVPSAAVAKAPDDGGWGQYRGVWRGHEAAVPALAGTLDKGGWGQAVSSQEPGWMGAHSSGETASPGK